MSAPSRHAGADATDLGTRTLGRQETLILSGSDIVRLLTPADCREAVERAFERLGQGSATPSKSLGFEAPGGTFHVKAARFDGEVARFVAKVNGNFPGNPAAVGLPTIQGVLVLADASNGRMLALMDSAALTALRAAAATAVAIRHLARADSRIAAIIGCGIQGRSHVDALHALGMFREIRLFDQDPARANLLAERNREGGPVLRTVSELSHAVRGAGVIVTCTSGSGYVLADGDVDPGALVAAVGADNPYKREIHPSLMRHARVIVDDLAQCASSGDLHHVLEANMMTRGDVHADLSSVVAATKPGRVHDHDTIVFDSTGIALEDAAAAGLTYELAVADGSGIRARLAG